MAEITFLGCNVKIWMYLVVSVMIIAGSLEVYHAVKNYDKTDKIVDRVLLIGVPVTFLSAAILGFVATCLDNSCLLCPLLIILTILLPLIIVSNIFYYINCMAKSECKGNATNMVSATSIFIVSVIICVSTLTIVCRYYRQINEEK